MKTDLAAVAKARLLLYQDMIIHASIMASACLPNNPIPIDLPKSGLEGPIIAELEARMLSLLRQLWRFENGCRLPKPENWRPEFLGKSWQEQLATIQSTSLEVTKTSSKCHSAQNDEEEDEDLRYQNVIVPDL